MSETIKIVKNDTGTGSFPISQGVRTTDLISRQNKLDDEEKEVLLRETTEILSNCINPINTTGSVTNLVVGYVQSGKTLSFTTLSTLAIDNGVRIIIYLAGIKNNLLVQTTKRLKKDLLTEKENSRQFKVYENPTVEQGIPSKISNALKLTYKPAILITVLKHTKHIDELTRIFSDISIKSELGNNGVLIIDDEADQASLNTYARKNSKAPDWADDEFSSTYASILRLKAALPNHSYIQYTATPQGPLLINLMDLLSPKHHTVLTPGKTYTGGKTFFLDNPDLIISIPDEQVHHQKNNNLSECPQSLIEAMQVYLTGVAIWVFIGGHENFLSMMIHADREIDASQKFHSWVRNLIDSWSERLGREDGDPTKTELVKEFLSSYQQTIRRLQSPPSFEDVMANITDVIRDTNVELVIQGSKEIAWSNAASHILIGADMLNRGFTVENLSVTYMPRYSVGKSTADTIQQRCRFFGYKRKYLDICRVYLPHNSVLEYVEYVQHEEIMRTWLKEKDSLEQVEQVLLLDPSMNATRNNILSTQVVKHKLSGWRQFNAIQNIDENTIFVENFLQNLSFVNFDNYGTSDRNHRYARLDIQTIIDFIKGFKLSNMPDALRKSATLQYLKYLSNERGVTHSYVIQMAHDVENGRERSFNADTMKISNIFSGRSSSVNGTYPGDKAFCFEDGICFQIHKIKLKHNSIKWGGKVCYTLGVYYPEDFAHAFTGISHEEIEDDNDE